MANQTTDKAYRTKGWVFLSLWAIFIAAGIISKRVFHHPDMMVFYHLPAAVFLVVAWFHLSTKVRMRYKESIARAEAYRNRRTSGNPLNFPTEQI